MSRDAKGIYTDLDQIHVSPDYRTVNSDNDFLGSIFVAEDIITADAQRVAFGNCKFKRDFGPWKKDQIVPVLVFDNVFGYLQTEKEDGVVIQECLMRLEPNNV